MEVGSIHERMSCECVYMGWDYDMGDDEYIQAMDLESGNKQGESNGL